MTTRDDTPLGCTRDAAGNELTYKDSTGYCREYTRDAAGRALSIRTVQATGASTSATQQAGY